jgi:hypothetical protein
LWRPEGPGTTAMIDRGIHHRMCGSYAMGTFAPARAAAALHAELTSGAPCGIPWVHIGLFG